MSQRTVGCKIFTYFHNPENDALPSVTNFEPSQLASIGDRGLVFGGKGFGVPFRRSCIRLGYPSIPLNFMGKLSNAAIHKSDAIALIEVQAALTIIADINAVQFGRILKI